MQTALPHLLNSQNPGDRAQQSKNRSAGMPRNTTADQADYHNISALGCKT
jgi:hypothetical protein